MGKTGKWPVEDGSVGDELRYLTDCESSEKLGRHTLHFSIICKWENVSKIDLEK